MIKQLSLLVCLTALPFVAQAAPSAYQKALTCKSDNCPYSYDFIATPKVKNSIQRAFRNAHIQPPTWLFSSNSVTSPVEPARQGKYRMLKVDSCMPHSCASNSVIGYYNPSTNRFSGIYTKDDAQIKIR